MADWSGAATGEQAGLRLAEVDPSGPRVVSVRALRRVDAVDRIVDAMAEWPDVVVGLDFSFSLPAWWLEASGIGCVDDLWGDAGRLEGWLRACEPPFWGRPGRRRPVTDGDELRLTELAARPRPRSTFQVGGAGAVGTASLRGMPHLARLRAAGAGIWPWDPWSGPVVAEVWPRLAIGSITKSSAAARAAWVEAHRHLLPSEVADAVAASADALDAVAAALDLAARPPPPPVPLTARVALEGWIAGVGAHGPEEHGFTGATASGPGC